MKLTGRRCQCAACGEYFNTVFAFDKHRTGSHAKDQRRCLKAHEMENTGMHYRERENERLWYGSKRQEAAG